MCSPRIEADDLCVLSQSGRVGRAYRRQTWKGSGECLILIILSFLFWNFNVSPKHEPMQVQALDDDAENTDNQKFTLRHAVGSLVRYV